MLPEVESLRVQSLWLLKKALPSREEPNISVSIVNSKHTVALMLLYSRFTRVISPKCGSVLNTRSNDFIRSSMIERVTSRKCYGSCCKGELLAYQRFIPGISAPCH